MKRLLGRFWPILSYADKEVGRWVTSRSMWLFLSPLTVLTLASHLMFDSLPRVGLMASVIGWLVSCLVLWFANITVFRHRATRPPQLAMVCGFWFVVGLVTYVTSDAWLRLTMHEGDSTSSLITDGMRYATAFTLRALLTAVLFSAVHATRDSLAALDNARSERRRALRKSDEYVISLKAKYVGFIHKSIEPKLVGLLADVRNLTEHPESANDESALAERINDFSVGQVRNLSHIVSEDNGIIDSPLTHVGAERDVRQLHASPLRGWLTEIPPVLPVVVVLVVLRFGYGAYEETSVTGIAGMGVLCVLLGLIVFVVGSISTRVPVEQESVRRLYGVLTIAMVLVAAMVVAYGFGGLGDPLPSARIAVVVHSLVALIGVWLVNYAVSRRERVMESVIQANNQLDLLKARQDQLGERLRQRLAVILHGPIQGRLALASMTLRQYVNDPRRSDLNYRQEVIARVIELLHSVEAEVAAMSEVEESAQSFADTIKRIDEEWVGVIQVEYVMGTGVPELLAHHREVDEALGMVAEEAIMNARRHGRARMLYVSVSCAAPDSRHLRIDVLDDGRGVPDDHSLGLGSQLFDRCTASWDLKRQSFGGTLFSATVAVPETQSTSNSPIELVVV